MKILYYFDLSASDEKMESHKSLNSSFIDEVSEAENRPESKLTEDPGNGETIDEFEKFETKRSKPNLKIQASQPKAEKTSPRLSLQARRQSLLALAGAILFATLQGVALQGGLGRGAVSLGS